jgi:hypothetical protein
VRPANDNEIVTDGISFTALICGIVLAVPLWVVGALLMMWLFRTVGGLP